ncbi:MAG: hypothetical protein OXC08_06865 [Thiotrichales bacterium]|nr:hypothetical protein [Thiotrichales bacterium]
MKGWRCVRYGDALSWVAALTEADAVRRSLEHYPVGAWTDDPRKLVVFPQDAYPDNTGPHDYTRAVLEARPSPPRRRCGRPPSGRSGVTLAFLAAALVLGLGLVPDASAGTWRGLTVAPEHRCAPYDEKRDCWPQSLEREPWK